MKTLRLILALGIFISGSALFAQKSSIDTEKSSIKWYGEKIGGSHEGYIKLKSGTLEVMDDRIVSGSFMVDMSSITNTDLEDEGYNKKLVDHLKSDDFFGVEKYPEASFVILKSTVFSDGKAEVSGEITIKGKTEPLSFDVTRKGNTYMASVDVDRSKFDVRYGSNSFFDNLGDMAIDDIFTLTIKLVTK